MNAQLEKTRHPLAGKRMTGADMIIQVLAQEGVDTIFGYSGGAILPTYDAIFRYNVERESNKNEQIQLIIPANEQGAGFMAARNLAWCRHSRLPAGTATSALSGDSCFLLPVGTQRGFC